MSDSQVNRLADLLVRMRLAVWALLYRREVDPKMQAEAEECGEELAVTLCMIDQQTFVDAMLRLRVGEGTDAA